MQLLAEFGQSVWLDYIDCSMLQNGKLQELISQGLRGMTSNPSIFNQVISTTQDYDDHILKLHKKGNSTFDIYDELTICDIQNATDAFLRVYESTKTLDGYVSLEINPKLAKRIDDSIKEGIRLFKRVNRPNLMIKVPATKEGFPVLEELISQGINVNTTLIFSKNQYEQTVAAYLEGLGRFAKKGGDLSKVRSVASVFISRIDSFVDKILEDKMLNEKNELKKKEMLSLKGKAAIANSLNIFKTSKNLFSTEKFKSLQSQNANLQRVLWASTSTKNPNYSDIKYVSELIATSTVNTIPEKTLTAFLDHGEVKPGFSSEDFQGAEDVISSLKSQGIDLNQVCDNLLGQGVASFQKAFDSLLLSIEEKSAKLSAKV